MAFNLDNYETVANRLARAFEEGLIDNRLLFEAIVKNNIDKHSKENLDFGFKKMEA